MSSEPPFDNTVQRVSKEIPPLPEEIWSIIFRLAIVPCHVLYQSCSSATFPWVQHACINDVFEYLPRWRYLRLVCRLWAHILDPLWTPRLEVDWGDTTFQVHNPILLKVRNNRCAKSEKMLELLFADSNLMNSTSTLQIYELKRKGGSSAISHVFSNMHFFPRVKSLTLLTSSTGVPNFWWQLQRGFSRITALFLTIWEPVEGSLELIELEVLRLDLRSPLKCRFPALKHCSLDARMVNTHPYEQLLQDHGKSLQSLILLGWPSIYFDDDEFWLRYPKLELLGLPEEDLSILSIPPVRHPLNHIYAEISVTYRMEKLVDIIRWTLKLKRFSVSFSNLGARAIMEPTLQHQCLEKGIVYQVIE